MKPFGKIPVIYFLLILGGCASIYYAPDAKSIFRGHKNVAILPFNVSIDVKRLPKNADYQSIRDMEKNEAYVIQNECQSIFLRRMGHYTVEFQDVSKTNALIEKAGLKYEDLRVTDKAELAKILSVDGVFTGSVHRQQPMSVGGAIAVNVLTGYDASTNKVDINATIHNGADGKLLWQYNHRISGGLGSSSEQLSRILMKQISRQFPYNM